MSAPEEMRDGIEPNEDVLLGAALRDAYPSPDPSDALRRRGHASLALAERRAASWAARSPIRKWGWRGGLGLVFAATSALAVHLMLNRAGEAAVRLIPADALIVATLDTTPSAAQVPLFTRIREALKREGLDGKIGEGLKRLTSESQVASLIYPHLTNNMAAALLDHGGAPLDADDAKPTVILALSDPAAVAGILASHTHRVDLQGMVCYSLPGKETYGMIVDSYLVIAPSTADLARIAQVRAGSAPSVADLPEYRAARSALPADASVMLFLSPSAIERAHKVGQDRGAHALAGPLWMAWSATIEDAGIRIDYRCPTETGDAMKWARRIADIAPVDDRAYREMPAGADIVIGLSQPGRYWEAASGAVASSPEMGSALRDDVRDFEEISGLSLEKDILPDHEGQWWLGIYPDDSWRGSAGAVIVMDDANGADPSALFAKASAAMERTLAPDNRSRLGRWFPFRHMIGQLPFGSLAVDAGVHDAPYNGPTPRLIPFERNGVRMWRFDAQSEADIARGAEGVGGLIGSDRPGAGQGAEPPAPGFAQVGRSMVFATSQPLLDRAVATLQGHATSLADDPAYATMRRSATPGAQTICMIDLHRILEALRPKLAELIRGDDAGLSADDIIGVFGNGATGLVVSSRYDGRVVTGTVLVPVDYERLIHLIGRVSRDVGVAAPGADTSSDPDRQRAEARPAPPPSDNVSVEPPEPPESPRPPEPPAPSDRQEPEVSVHASPGSATSGRSLQWHVRMGALGRGQPTRSIDMSLPMGSSGTTVMLRPDNSSVGVELRTSTGTAGDPVVSYSARAPGRSGTAPADIEGQLQLTPGSRGWLLQILEARSPDGRATLRQIVTPIGQPWSNGQGVYVEITPAGG